MTRQEGNKLIAEFMGMKRISPDWWVDAKTEETLIVGEYAPNKDWNELMPVVEKISNTVISGSPYNSDEFVRVEIVPGGYVRISNLRDPEIFTNVSKEGSVINAVFKAVAQFIQSYNTASLTTNKEK